ncbi:hypothetical protein Sps_01455 [Shewanella psychrophila]|uniref:Uncharacterized protein n=2 Tax=Shewanella psychrophila TaxID=225848 RepID=A0A1S6HM53_9GAMM|nr:hypothetical protein Sps_01455 [Shewanella psychrophila]
MPVHKSLPKSKSKLTSTKGDGLESPIVHLEDTQRRAPPYVSLQTVRPRASFTSTVPDASTGAISKHGKINSRHRSPELTDEIPSNPKDELTGASAQSGGKNTGEGYELVKNYLATVAPEKTQALVEFIDNYRTAPKAIGLLDVKGALEPFNECRTEYFIALEMFNKAELGPKEKLAAKKVKQLVGGLQAKIYYEEQDGLFAKGTDELEYFDSKAKENEKKNSWFDLTSGRDAIKEFKEQCKDTNRPFVPYHPSARGDMNNYKYSIFLSAEKRPLTSFEYFNDPKNDEEKGFNRNVNAIKQHLTGIPQFKEGRDYVFCTNAERLEIKGSVGDINKTHYKSFDNVLTNPEVRQRVQEVFEDDIGTDVNIKRYLSSKGIDSPIISNDKKRKNSLAILNINIRESSQTWDPREYRHTTNPQALKSMVDSLREARSNNDPKVQQQLGRIGGDKLDICIIGSQISIEDRTYWENYKNDQGVKVYFLNDMVSEENHLNRIQQKKVLYALCEGYKNTTYIGHQSGVNEDAPILPRTNVYSLSEYQGTGQLGISRVEARTQLDIVQEAPLEMGTSGVRNFGHFYSLRNNEFLTTKGILASVQIKMDEYGKEHPNLDNLWQELKNEFPQLDDSNGAVPDGAVERLYQKVLQTSGKKYLNATTRGYVDDALRLCDEEELDNDDFAIIEKGLTAVEAKYVSDKGGKKDKKVKELIKAVSKQKLTRTDRGELREILIIIKENQMIGDKDRDLYQKALGEIVRRQQSGGVGFTQATIDFVADVMKEEVMPHDSSTPLDKFLEKLKRQNAGMTPYPLGNQQFEHRGLLNKEQSATEADKDIDYFHNLFAKENDDPETTSSEPLSRKNSTESNNRDGRSPASATVNNSASSVRKRIAAKEHKTETISRARTLNKGAQTTFIVRDNLQYFEETLSSHSDSSLTDEEKQVFQQTMRNAMLSSKYSSDLPEQGPALKELRLYGLKVLSDALEKGYRDEVSSVLNQSRHQGVSDEKTVFDCLINSTLEEKDTEMRDNMTRLLGQFVSDPQNLTKYSLGMVYQQSHAPASRYLLRSIPKEAKRGFLDYYRKPRFLSQFVLGEKNLKPIIKQDLERPLPLFKSLELETKLPPIFLSRTKMEEMINQKAKRLDDLRIENIKRETDKRNQLQALKERGLTGSGAEKAVDDASTYYGNPHKQADILKQAIAKHESKVVEDKERALGSEQMDQEYTQRRRNEYTQEANRKNTIRQERESECARIEHQRRDQEIYQAEQAQRYQAGLAQRQQRELKAQSSQSGRAVNGPRRQQAITNGGPSNPSARQAITSHHRSAIAMDDANQQLASSSTSASTNPTITYQEQHTVKAGGVVVYNERGEEMGRLMTNMGQHIKISQVDDLKMRDEPSTSSASGSVIMEYIVPGNLRECRGHISVQPAKRETQKVSFSQVSSGPFDSLRYPTVSVHYSLDEWRNALK